MAPKLTEKVWQLTKKEVGVAERLVLALLAWRADDYGVSWPGVPTIARQSSMSVRAARMVLRRLEAKGYVQVKERRGRGRSNLYNVYIPPRPPRLDPARFAADAAVGGWEPSTTGSLADLPADTDPKNRKQGSGFPPEKPAGDDTKNRNFATPKPEAGDTKTGKSHARSRSQILLNTYKNNRNRDSDSVSSLSSILSQDEKDRLKPGALPFIKAGGEGGEVAQEPGGSRKCKVRTCTSPVAATSPGNARFCTKHGNRYSGYLLEKKQGAEGQT